MTERTEVRPAGRQPMAREPSDRRALAVMTVSHGIQHFYVAGLAVTYPFVVAEFHIPYAELGAVLTAAGLLGGFLQGSAAVLRRLSTRSILAGQNAGMAVASLAAAVAPAFAVFGAARLLGSAVSWPQHPVGSAYLSERFPHRRATALSWHTAGGSIGTAVVPLLAAAVIAAAGWRWALGALGAVLGAGGLLVFLGLPREAGRGQPAPDARAAAPVPLWRLLRRRQVAAVLIAGTVAAGGRGLGTLSTYVPAYLRSDLHLPALTVGSLFTVVMVASILGQVAGGMLADRFGRYRALVATYLAGAGAIAWFGYAGHDVVTLGVLGALVGILAYAESPLLQSLFSDLTQDGAARSAFGAFFAIGYGVGSLWLAIIGWIITAAGFPAAFTAMAASFAAAAVIILALGREQRAA
ncbi:MAG TPA: MFS transporter [Streptosporangiaceae bacterium]|nr:MFS transporter [Streptosporangiaceae bacterium]